MISKIVEFILALLSLIIVICIIALFFIGCKEVYVDRPVYVATQSKLPAVECDLNKSTYTEIVYSAKSCIELYRARDRAFK